MLEPLGSRKPERITGYSADVLRTHPALFPGRVLARDVVSPVDLPAFDNSQMDGYAVRSAEVADAVASGRPFPIGARIAAGSPVGELPPGTAAPIMTGAAVPRGADAVIPIEAATPNRFLPEASTATVSFADPVDAGTFVRTAGSDLRQGELLLAAGTRLGPAQWGVLAAAGCPDIDLVPRVRVIVISTGEELRQPGAPLGSGQIYDANSAILVTALTECGADVVHAATVSDSGNDLRGILAERGADADLLVTSGGVSAGAYEVVRDVLEGAGLDFGSVAVQPGGPQGLGVADLHALGGASGSLPVVAFPGNPVSALVSFELFLRPVLRALAGLPASRPVDRLPLAEPVTSPPAKHQVRRGTVDAHGRVRLQGGASSHLLHAYAGSSVLVHLPVGCAAADAGDLVEVWRIDAA